MKTTLTARELEISRLGADGLCDAEISEKLSITENTVQSHFKNIYNKTGLNRPTLWKIFNQFDYNAKSDSKMILMDMVKGFRLFDYNAKSDSKMMDAPPKHLWAIQTHKSEPFKLCEFFYTEDEAAEAFKNIHAYRKEGITL